MPHLHSKPLIACTTREDKFCDQIEAAANQIGSDFWSSHDIGLTIQECETRRPSCMILDYACTEGLSNQLPTPQKRDSRSLLVVVPNGDVRAAFRSANIGAINVIEKPVASQELIINLKTALASEHRLMEIHDSARRFASSYFNDLTVREKNILGLLMNGEPNKRVASILDIGLRTVEAERAQVMRKLEVNSFVELIGLVTRLEYEERETRQEIFYRMLAEELKSAH